MKTKNRPILDCFTGRIKQLRIISQHGTYWNRLLPYDESEQRLTINDRGQVWLTRYDRASNPFDPDQLLSKQYFRLSKSSVKLIIDVATDFFVQYKHRIIRDAPIWYADLVNTDGKMLYTDGPQSYHEPPVTHSLTETIRRELRIPDLAVIGDEAPPEEEEYIEQDWYVTAPLEEIIQMAENGLEIERNCRIELLRALEYKYWDLESLEKHQRERVCMLMQQYVESLEHERPVRHSTNTCTWK